MSLCSHLLRTQLGIVSTWDCRYLLGGLQILLVVYVAVPIFVIMPVLIYAPKALWHYRRSLGLFKARGTEESISQHQRLQKFSEHWKTRFVFAVLLWLSFISFIAASQAIQATPSPGIACDGAYFRQDASFTCYSDELTGSHVLGSVVTALLCWLFPLIVFWNIRRISLLDLETDETESLRFGMFYEGYRKGVRQYFFLLHHFQMTVLIAVLGLLLINDALGLAISNLVLNLLYILVVIIGRPFESWFDVVLEASQTSVQAYAILITILDIIDDSIISNEAKDVLLQGLRAHAMLIYCFKFTYLSGGLWVVVSCFPAVCTLRWNTSIR